jgi:hypothetical protein
MLAPLANREKGLASTKSSGVKSPGLKTFDRAEWFAAVVVLLGLATAFYLLVVSIRK